MNEVDKEILLVVEVCLSSMSCLVVLSNAPVVFQELLSVVLQDLDDCAIAYLDDILVFSPTLEDHLKHFDVMFGRLRKHDLRLKLNKCNFFEF